MNQPKDISIIFLSYMAELTACYPLYYLLQHLLKTPGEQILSLGGTILLGSAMVGFYLLLASRPIRMLLLWVGSMAAALGLSYLLQAWMQPEALAFTVYIQVLYPRLDHLLSTVRAWALLIFVGFLLLRAMRIVTVAIGYKQATRRFEASMGTLFTGLVLCSVLSLPPEPVFIAMGLSLLANVGALAFARSPHDNPGGKWLSLLLYGVVIAVAGGLVSALAPALTWASHWLWGTTTPVLTDLVERAIEWAFFRNVRGDNAGNVPEAGGSGSTGSGPDTGGYLIPPEWMQHLVSAVFWVAVSVVVIVLIASLVYLLTRLWYRRNPARLVQYSAAEGTGFWRQCIHFLIRLFVKINLLLQPLRLGSMDTAELYHCLLIWGNLRRQPRQAYETPYEYGERLGRQYPERREDILLLTEAYVNWRYGRQDTGIEGLQQMRASLRRL